MMEPGAYAAIDVGSNSVKLLIADLDGTGAFAARFEAVRITRLGEGIHARRLSEPAIRRTLDALGEFAAACEANRVRGIAAVGTSALRDAMNGEEFCARAGSLGLTVQAITGEDEARYSYLAVRLDPYWKDVDSLLVLDIGGGSTEVIWGGGESRRPRRRQSLNLGAVRLTEAALRSDPVTVQEIDRAMDEARRELRSVDPPAGAAVLVGVGGTCTTVAAVDLAAKGGSSSEIHGRELSVAEIEAQMRLYASLTTEGRKKIAGLNPARADIILGGTIILCLAIQQLQQDRIAISARGLRWGLLYDRFGPGGPDE